MSNSNYGTDLYSLEFNVSVGDIRRAVQQDDHSYSVPSEKASRDSIYYIEKWTDEPSWKVKEPRDMLTPKSSLQSILFVLQMPLGVGI
jgi:hypothetical protein